MKQYLLNLYQPVGGSLPPERLEAIMRDVRSVKDEMEAAGASVFSGGLHSPETATVVRPAGDELLVTDGPFTEGKEHVGGLTVIRTPDLDAALEWAGRLARATTLPIEVRPFQDEH